MSLMPLLYQDGMFLAISCSETGGSPGLPERGKRSCVLRGNSRTSPLRTGSHSVLWAKPVPLVDVSSNCRTGSEVSLGLRKTET